MTQVAKKAALMSTTSQHKTPPGPRSHFLLGSALDIQRDPVGFFSMLAHQYGDIARTHLLTQPTYMIFHPDYVQHVLQGNNQNYDRNNYTYTVLRQFIGNGLATIDGASWLHQRRLMQPAFHRKRIAAFGTLMTDATTRMLEQWQSHAQRNQPFNVSEEMFQLTLRIIGQALFSIDLSNEANSASRAFMTVNKLLTNYFF